MSKFCILRRFSESQFVLKISNLLIYIRYRPIDIYLNNFMAFNVILIYELWQRYDAVGDYIEIRYDTALTHTCHIYICLHCYSLRYSDSPVCLPNILVIDYQVFSKFSKIAPKFSFAWPKLANLTRWYILLGSPTYILMLLP